MKILAMDSSGLVATVAIVSDDTLIAEYTVNHKKTHSQTLMGMLDEIVRMTEQDLKTIDVIAVSKGPGSFTGLRIGSSSAKGLAMALDKPIVSVPTVDAIAFNMWGCDGIVCPIMDARRNQVYTGTYLVSDGFETICPQRAIGIEELIEELDAVANQQGKRVVFLGDGVPVYSGIIDEKMKARHIYAPASLNRQRASSVAVLGGMLYEQGKAESQDMHAPVYLRVSQAERERAEKQALSGGK